MYENITESLLLSRMMDRVKENDPNLDTRTAAIIYNALSAMVLEAKNIYISLDNVLNATFPDTAPREYLIREAAPYGIVPYLASAAVMQGEFNVDIPTGSRFTLGALFYTATERISAGVYKMTCETAGRAGSDRLGALIPVERIDGLTSAVLTAVLIPGEDEEETEVFRKRFISSLIAQAFGGNKKDYKDKVLSIPGVGGVKVYRAWNSDIRPSELIPPDTFDLWLASLSDLPTGIYDWLVAVSTAAKDGKLTVGGTVRLTIIASDWTVPSDVLIDTVQTEIDPEQNHGEGDGVAPIGHVVTVRGVEGATIDTAMTLVFQSGYDWETARPSVEAAIDTYFEELAKTWEGESQLVVRLSQIETRILGLVGIIDIYNVTVNGFDHNYTLGENEIPVRGEITLV